MTPDGFRLLPEGSVIAVAGAGGPAGQAAVRRLSRAGAVVEAADAARDRLDEAVALAPRGRAHGTSVDLTDPAATRAWADEIEERHGRVDGLVHLVGGWRGGKDFSDNTLEDWEFLHRLLVRTVQNTSLAFHDALARAQHGRFVLISATAAAKPTAGNAGYAAAKAAAEAWTLAMADSFRRLRKDRAVDGPAGDGVGAEPLDGPAAAILVVKALVWPLLRVERPDAKFPGYTDVADLAEEIAALWDRPTDDVNGQRLCLTQ
ncbi:SDR family NAD(P)-dependent oxidoreductase [Yinghuangia sp. YIM S09857]|uniref:SDR family NAD(P)-dependent oxidoreductase n=1 Tax=Yinghuangia sp. YIM S09857 TaxID=3436929 RepID=UPI003F53484B